MAGPNPEPIKQEQRVSDQSILNDSFDSEFKISVSEIAGYNVDTDTLKRIACDPQGRLKVVIDSGSITFPSEIEIKNDVGNPLPISATSLPLPTNAATEATVNSVKTNLDSALSKLDSIITNTGNIKIDADSINLNTDTLEAKLDSLIAKDYATQTTLAQVKSDLDSILAQLDVTLSSRTKPSDQQHTIIDSGSTSVNNFPVDQLVHATNLDVALSTRTKPSDQQHVIIDTIPEVEIKNDSGNPVPVSGTVTVSNPTANPETGLAKEATLEDIDVDVEAVRDRLPATLDADGGLKTHVQNFPASQAVTGPLTDTQLRAVPVPISGALTQTQFETELDEKFGNLGQTNMAGSSPVVIASDQSTIPISASSLPLPTGAATSALQTQPGVDIGDVTINNTSGAAAVNIQDGGNTITVDGTITANQGTANATPWRVDTTVLTNTYSAAVINLTVAATPTDIFTIYGSATKTVKIVRIEFSATQNTSAIRDILLIKRSSTNTGGTSSSATIAPNDSNNSAVTATVLSYTVNPSSLGTSVGTIRATKIDIPATNLVGNADRIIWTFGDVGQPLVLRGTSQGLAINLNSVTSSSNLINISIEWTEE